MEKAVDLPEILDHLARYLSRNSLAIGCRVNRRWFASLHPQLWSDLKFDCSTSSTLRPTQHQIRDHLQLIRHLELSAMPSNEFTHFEGACHLRTLIYDNMWEQIQTADRSDSPTVPGPWSTLSNLVIHSGSTLRDLSILTQQTEPRVDRLDTPDDAVVDSGTATPFWRSAADHCLGIERLVLRYVHISNEDSPAFWSLCSRQVKRLYLGRARLPPVAPVLATLDDIDDYDADDLLEQQYPRMDKIKELTFYGVEGLSPRKQVQLWQRCPNLQTLVWDDTHRREQARIASEKQTRFASETFAEALAEDSWPLLNNISIYCEWMTADQVALILNSVQTLRFLRLSPVLFGSDAFSALNQPHHVERMEQLILTSPDALDHSQTLTILETFKSLKKFRGGRICLNLIDLEDAVVSLRDNPWACKNLERLSIDICEEIPPEENEDDGESIAGIGQNPTRSVLVRQLSPENRIKIQRMLLEQLGNLCQLQEVELHSIKDWERAPRRRRTPLLRLEVMPYRRPSPHLLCFEKQQGDDLQSPLPPTGGLTLLKRWTKLRFLRFQGQQDLGEAEILWMKTNWPLIWILEGPLHSNRPRHEQLVEFMEARGILRY